MEEDGDGSLNGDADTADRQGCHPDESEQTTEHQ
jgi:hypothetical protein